MRQLSTIIDQMAQKLTTIIGHRTALNYEQNLCNMAAFKLEIKG